MAQLSGGTLAAIRMDQFDLFDLMKGDPLIKDATTFQVDKTSKHIDTMRGASFTYGPVETPDFDQLFSGILFTIDRTSGDEILLKITGLSTALSRMTKILREEGNAKALDYTFASDDDMRGTAFADYLRGYGGHDDLFGADGADTLQGGAGNDHLYGHSANGGADGNDSIAGQDGVDYLQGNAGNDTLDGGTGADRIQGGQGNDNILGGAGNDTVNANLGNDTINAGDGADSVRGGQGNDSILGGAGNDSLSGDLGSDTLNGGAGSDSFFFGGDAARFTGMVTDVIADFQNGADRIGIGYSVAAVLTGGSQTSFSAATAAAQTLFNDHAGNGAVATIAVGSDTYLFFASDGGATADSVIRLTRVSSTAIDGGDFL